MSPGKKFKKVSGSLLFSLAIADESIFILGGEKDILNNYKWTKRADVVVYPKIILKSFYFVFQSLPEVHGDTLILYLPTCTAMILIALVTKLV